MPQSVSPDTLVETRGKTTSFPPSSSPSATYTHEPEKSLMKQIPSLQGHFDLIDETFESFSQVIVIEGQDPVAVKGRCFRTAELTYKVANLCKESKEDSLKFELYLDQSRKANKEVIDSMFAFLNQ
ncbi:UNVERIFIED_CONTAM: hypothetical protein HDU68_011803 [Siphonaria sp. JEL0065]|nr:hypothetical protein HDU68_011803 [Siphonaria sp. JEL0065]